MPRSFDTIRGVLTVATILLSTAAANAQSTDTPKANDRETWVNKAERKIKKYELGRKNLAIEGYDPVAYFPEGGGKPQKGKKDYEYTHRGVVYRFVSAKHRDMFKEDPDKYEPTHGGWCAYAMAKGDYTEPNPKRFLIQNGRLMLFYDGLFGDTYKMWLDENPEELEKKADEFWEKESGEKPRIPEDENADDKDNQNDKADDGSDTDDDESGG
ncbi:MAG: hypothetical protein KDA31_08945 [Phycisphaerales bacterium]|nr:hypothetical protein [Phycisphaerales bacterium]MCB9836850.1 hypothetical protein [Phycisphaera sp.]